MKRGKKHPKIEIICKECEIKFFDWPSNRRIFCSLKCRSNNQIGSLGFWYGKKRSKETNEKISKSLKGRKSSMSEEGKKIASEKISKLFRGKPKPNQSGEKHYRWKGGVTPINEKIRRSIEYKNWHKAVMERDGYVCVIGGKKHGNKVHADHIKPFAYFPELRFELSNGRTLCVECHRKTDTWGHKAIKNNEVGYRKDIKPVA